MTVLLKAQSWSPSVLYPGNGDTRQLGVRVFQVEMQADHATAPAALIGVPPTFSTVR